jgi:hypothetical protein
MAFLFLIACFIIRIIAIGLLLRNRKTAGLRIWPLTIFLFASLISDAQHNAGPTQNVIRPLHLRSHVNDVSNSVDFHFSA